MTKTLTLTKPELAALWAVEPVAGRSLVLSPRSGPTSEESEAERGERAKGEDFERRRAPNAWCGEG